jgi:hypothetical protein
MIARFSRADWRLIGVGALGALLPALLVLAMIAGNASTTRSELATARRSLTAARDSLGAARALVTSGIAETASERARIDSLWRVIASLRAAQRARQRTVPAAGEAPSWSLVAAITAERDTAIADRDAALAQLEVMRTTAGEIRRTALHQLVQDSTRLVRIGAVLEGTAASLGEAERALRPRWHVRLGRGLRSLGEKVLIGGIGYGLGRLT